MITREVCYIRQESYLNSVMSEAKSETKRHSIERYVQSVCLAMICAAIVCVPYWLAQNTTPHYFRIQAENIYLNVKKAQKMQVMQSLRKRPEPKPGMPSLCAKSDKKVVGQKILSYSLYGKWAEDSHWTNMMDILSGEAANSTLYSDWIIRLYHDEKLPKNRIFALSGKHKNLRFCDIRNIPSYGDLSGVSGREWRFLPIGDKTVDVTCVRDIDSPLLKREFDAVQQWLDSEKLFHCMRDHPQHGGWRVLAGLFCFRNSKNETVSDLVFNAIRKHGYHKNETFEPFKESDQTLLRDFVWPLVRHDSMQHDGYSCERYPESYPFPSRRETNSSGFMGCKRPCTRVVPPCPLKCRPKNHQDWMFC
ncbi:uncharacterized protein LOC130641169 [Hydractinia symbiolongicarpus]|uniref:uncharacterized protein LOC130641169 n=1 Tax=Hydractinia symbiolongicarpus TaxID=13093 RepID=UPI00254D3FD7|nr:uncharacterized protein LOC130641169 [Hydractinia symbiolongicarpus]